MKMNGRITLKRNRVWEKEKDGWSWMREGSQMKRGRKEKVTRRISKEDWWNFGLTATWNRNEKMRNWRMRNLEIMSFSIVVRKKG